MNDVNGRTQFISDSFKVYDLHFKYFSDFSVFVVLIFINGRFYPISCIPKITNLLIFFVTDVLFVGQ